ncbi:MAG TPA: cyclic nucleotide-binding domain-containing protein [Cycloclasticus sp.]|jgi:predicted acylesterase/phospholipase RssA/CRP-like cAMP-binding protein|nr:cyclic nucleotide-binding domain-containing protein [Cycloclasticus sp.]HIL92500.1 cyclic nucleotide-binding domain-containing protein [Cycloclasticus sp.]
METSNLSPSLSLLRQSHAFDHFNDKALAELCVLFTSIIFKGGEAIPIRRGHNEGYLYLITSGSFNFNLLITDSYKKVLITLKQTDLASGFLSHASYRNQTTLTANGDCTAFRVLWKDLNDFLNKHPMGVNHFNSTVQTVVYQAQLSMLFSTKFQIHNPAFFSKPPSGFEWKKLQNGETLFRQGDPGGSIYIVLTGRLKAVERDENGENPTVSNIISAGEVSGEVALLTHSNRVSTVFAIRDSVVAKFSRSAFNSIVEKHPQFMFQLATLLGNRVKFQSNGERVNDSRKTYALIPSHQGHSLGGFAESLCRAMREWGSILCLSSEDINKAMGIQDIAIDNSKGFRYTSITQWIEHQELIYDHIILVADSQWTNWNEKILRHSDELLIVADSKHDPEPGEHERKITNAGLIAKHQKKKLILIHSDAKEAISGTGHWLNSRNVDDWCHIRHGIEADIQRLGRLLTGHAYALVLGGGGARGYAHIGVIRALEEHGIPIDKVCGTSIGAIIASGVSIGYDSKDISRLCKTHLKKLFDYTLPVLSLIKGKRIEHELKAAFGNQLIEDLLIPFFCISTNLTRAEQIIHTRGVLRDALRCSMSLPAMIPPVCKGGDLIVDGGLLNNLPIDKMRHAAGDCHLIASDISPKLDLTNNTRFSSNISGLKILISRINPFQKSIKTPNILHILERSVTVAAVNYGAQVQAQNLADLHIELPVENISTLNYDLVDKTANLGYRYSLKLIKDWVEKR